MTDGVAAGKVSVIVPTLDAERTIGEQLEALSRQTYRGEWEIVVADNGSTDRTLDVVQSWATRLPALRIVDASARRGAAHARNVAADAAGDVLAFCDADDVVEPGWLGALVEALSDSDIVGGRLEHELLNDRASAAWRGGCETELLLPCGFLPAAVSANCGVRRQVWEAIGGFSDGYHLSCEDIDFCWRAQLAGFTIAFAPHAVVHYRHRSSAWENARQVYSYAREEARLVRDFGDYGATPPRLPDILRSYLFLLTRLPFLVLSRRRRGSWLTAAAAALGRASGTIRYRLVASAGS